MEFQPFPKIPRLRRDVVITEKIDGTNACVVVEPMTDLPPRGHMAHHVVYAQSRNRIITPDQDNAGFARWVHERHAELAMLLGPGRHYGEWWGQGIQRGYGLDHKRFSLFNTARWDSDNPAMTEIGMYVVPVIVPVAGTEDSSWIMSDSAVDFALVSLRIHGSHAAPGFDKPEGVVVYHKASGQMFKVLLENDELPKGVTTRLERELAEKAVA